VYKVNDSGEGRKTMFNQPMNQSAKIKRIEVTELIDISVGTIVNAGIGKELSLSLSTSVLNKSTNIW
jgi:hypothetical protein